MGGRARGFTGPTDNRSGRASLAPGSSMPLRPIRIRCRTAAPPTASASKRTGPCDGAFRAVLRGRARSRGPGLKLVAGRNFNAEEIADRKVNDLLPPSAVIVTRQLADKLFPNGNALGQSVVVEFQKHTTPIVGIVDRLQVPWVSAAAGAASSMTIPCSSRFASWRNRRITWCAPSRAIGGGHAGGAE